MIGRINFHKLGHIVFIVDVPDGQGGITQTRNAYISQFVQMIPKATNRSGGSSGNKNVEGSQLGQNTSFDCQMILPATGIPSEQDLLNVDGKDYAISNAYIDDSVRVKQLKFTATIRT